MNDIKTIKITDPTYPESLKKITDAPKLLYHRGVLPKKDACCVGIVGTRRPSAYGQQSAMHITGGLAEAGVTVVSGMAPGIDTIAHKTCLEKDGRTIAVLGTGLDEKSIYPQTNLMLSRNIIAKGGCLISELPPGTFGSKFNFPRRNRIISALSLAVLVIEAKEKSGSLITADYAKKQGKKLFAVPGPIFSSNSAGPNALIKKGAVLTQSPDDILRELQITPARMQKQLIAENNEESLILEALSEEALYIDKIIEKTKLNSSSVAALLALMEISGKIRNLGGNVYSLNK